ncbi:hypothetical protein [Actinomadura parmotrematis]|uniref:Lipoprotein n=1 Tax=Actinomadura parmotrematis TaxID=2864039 RepID=A0ABS7FQW7_9ACTN|nr:hypothetical protein [Actinomadura parmotrematis]MBW8481947.1 hypothetical protein [Actinomadura parmotrematis]
MLRKIIVLPVLLATLVGAGACGGGSKDAAPVGNTGSAVAASGTASGSASPAACPSEATAKLAKTRFVADAGLAFGAFHRWIYKPYQAGTFKSGADGRTKAIVKAAAAGAFALNRLNAGRKMVNADPTLCKALKQPLDAAWNKISQLTGKLKSGDVDPSEIGAVGGALDALKSQASQAGVNIKDRDVPNV